MEPRYSLYHSLVCCLIFNYSERYWQQLHGLLNCYVYTHAATCGICLWKLIESLVKIQKHLWILMVYVLEVQPRCDWICLTFRCSFLPSSSDWVWGKGKMGRCIGRKVGVRKGCGDSQRKLNTWQRKSENVVNQSVLKSCPPLLLTKHNISVHKLS
jgi:hypothetical protein